MIGIIMFQNMEHVLDLNSFKGLSDEVNGVA